MKLKTLRCPNCGATLEIEDGLDTFFCKYCGHHIILEDQSDAAYKAKVKVKYMEHKERLQDKRNEQERYKMEFHQKDERHSSALLLGFTGAIVLLFIIMSIFGNAGAKKQDQQLQKVVDEIMVDIKNENFADAYVKANTLYWDDSWTSEGEEKWNATRKEIIHQIEKAEKSKTGSTIPETSEDEKEEKGEKKFWEFWK